MGERGSARRRIQIRSSKTFEASGFNPQEVRARLGIEADVLSGCTDRRAEIHGCNAQKQLDQSKLLLIRNLLRFTLSKPFYFITFYFMRTSSRPKSRVLLTVDFICSTSYCPRMTASLNGSTHPSITEFSPYFFRRSFLIGSKKASI